MGANETQVATQPDVREMSREELLAEIASYGPVPDSYARLTDQQLQTRILHRRFEGGQAQVLADLLALPVPVKLKPRRKGQGLDHIPEDLDEVDVDPLDLEDLARLEDMGLIKNDVIQASGFRAITRLWAVFLSKCPEIGEITPTQAGRLVDWQDMNKLGIIISGRGVRVQTESGSDEEERPLVEQADGTGTQPEASGSESPGDRSSPSSDVSSDSARVN